VWNTQLTSEKDRGVARLQEERERAERDQQAALAEAVKGQATLRAELAATLQRVKVISLCDAATSAAAVACGCASFAFCRTTNEPQLSSCLCGQFHMSIFLTWVSQTLLCPLQNEEQKRSAEQDTHLTKYREKLLTAHSLEIEKINERHRNEMKKYHVSALVVHPQCAFYSADTVDM
jgi:hypothetical protein